MRNWRQIAGAGSIPFMRWMACVFLLVGCGSSSSPEPGPTEPMQCNGQAHLCDRAFNDVAYATTHNAMSSAEDGFRPPNQNYAIATQLEDGVRALMLDAHLDNGEPMLCHGWCDVGRTPLADGLRPIRTFLDAHPNEVITIIWESYVEPQHLEAAVREAGLLDEGHAQEPGSPWPTLRTLIERRTRVIHLTDDGGGAYPWLLDVWDHAFETPYSYASSDDFTCATNRGTRGNALFIFNHFLTNPFPDVLFAEEVNHNPMLLERARECEQEAGQLPNFITVDFYDVGDVLAVVEELNRE